MYQDFAICKEAEEYSGCRLNAVYYISADQTYGTPHKILNEGTVCLVFTRRGTGRVECDGNRLCPGENSIVYLKPEKSLSYFCKDKTWEFWWIEYRGEAFAPVNRVLSFEADVLTQALFSRCLEYAKSDEWEIASSILHTLNLIASRIAGSSEKERENKKLVDSAEKLVRENIRTVNVKIISETFGIQERTLRGIFTKTAGVSPQQMIIRIRMEQAGKLLLSTDMPVAEIAVKTGYANQYHFGSAFKKYYGITPGKYRRNIGLLQ